MPAAPPASPRRPAAALAWVGERADVVQGLGEALALHEDSDDFLLDPQAFEHELYLIQMAQRGVGATDLVRLVRRRTAAGIIVLGDAGGDDFVSALESGADMVLPPQAPLSHLRAAITALRRRLRPADGTSAHAAAAPRSWTLLASQAVLRAPDGTRIALSDSDLALMRCFAEAQGGQVPRRTLIRQLWGRPAGSMDSALHATVYRLRKRIEQAGQALAPVHAVSRVGYEFRAPLVSG